MKYFYLKIFLLFFSILVELNVYSQTRLAEIVENPEYSGGIYYSYHYSPGLIVPPPDGYQPFYISHYGRHGSRYHTSEEAYIRPLVMLRKVGKLGKLMPKGQEVLAKIEALAMDAGVNFTAGLPVVRTSPAHGTAYDIAGKGIASEDSFRQAIYVAIDVFRNRQSEKALRANPLRKQYYEKRDDSDKLKLDSAEEEV